MCLTVCMLTSWAPGVSLNVCICLLAGLGIWGCSPCLIKYLPRSEFVRPRILSHMSLSAWGGVHSSPCVLSLHSVRGSCWAAKDASPTVSMC